MGLMEAGQQSLSDVLRIMLNQIKTVALLSHNYKIALCKSRY